MVIGLNKLLATLLSCSRRAPFSQRLSSKNQREPLWEWRSLGTRPLAKNLVHLLARTAAASLLRTHSSIGRSSDRPFMLGLPFLTGLTGGGALLIRTSSSE